MKRYGAKIADNPREWLLHEGPAGAPLVIFLTGTGGTAAWADHETGWSKIAAREGFALAIPEALPPDPTKPRSFLANPPRWNDGSPPLFQHTDTDDVAFLDAIIEHAICHLSIAARRVFVTGFSNGAGMTFRFAAERAERVAAIAPVAGLCWVANPKPSRPVSTLYTVGAEDLLIPLRGGDVRLPWNNRLVRRPPVSDTLERWAVAIGCSPISVPQSEGTVRIERYPGPVTFDAVTVEGLGHHWPGGRAQLNARTAGPPSGAVHATERIWEFFKAV